jgi:hypothetical protein
MYFIAYASLVPISVVMVTVVAVNPMPVVPVVRGARVIGVRIWLRIVVRSIVPIWVIPSISRIAIIAARESNPNSPNSD